jgi:hypothetical protein
MIGASGGFKETFCSKEQALDRTVPAPLDSQQIMSQRKETECRDGPSLSFITYN